MLIGPLRRWGCVISSTVREVFMFNNDSIKYGSRGIGNDLHFDWTTFTVKHPVRDMIWCWVRLTSDDRIYASNNNINVKINK